MPQPTCLSTPDSNAPEGLVDGVRSQANLILIDRQVGDMSLSLSLYESIPLCVLVPVLFCLQQSYFILLISATIRIIHGLHMLRLPQALTPLYALFDIPLCPKKLSLLIPYRS